MERISGIYKITNLRNNKFYIGSAKDIMSRRYQHFYQLINQEHCNRHLQRSWNLAEPNNRNFKFEVLEFCELPLLLIREQHYLDTLLFAQEYIRKEDNRFRKLGYNIEPTAGNSLGRKASKETSMKQSLALKGKKRSEETRKRMSGRVWKKESLEKLSVSLTKYAISNIPNLKNIEKSKFLKDYYKKSRINAYNKVYQYTLEGEFIKEWNSTGEVGEFYKVSYKSVWNNCIDKTKQCVGFRFSYIKHESLPTLPKRTSGSKLVAKYSKQHELLDIYTSIADAARDMGFKGSANIIKVIKGERAFCGNYIWKYYEIK